MDRKEIISIAHRSKAKPPIRAMQQKISADIMISFLFFICEEPCVKSKNAFAFPFLKCFLVSVCLFYIPSPRALVALALYCIRIAFALCCNYGVWFISRQSMQRHDYEQRQWHNGHTQGEFPLCNNNGNCTGMIFQPPLCSLQSTGSLRLPVQIWS